MSNLTVNKDKLNDEHNGEINIFLNEKGQYTAFMAVVEACYFLDGRTAKTVVMPKDFVSTILNYLDSVGHREVKRVKHDREMFTEVVMEFLTPRVFSGNNLDSGKLSIITNLAVIDCVMEALIYKHCKIDDECTKNTTKRFFNHFKNDTTFNTMKWFEILGKYIDMYGNQNQRKYYMEVSLEGNEK